MYQVSFIFLIYVQSYAPEKLLIAKIIKASNSNNTGTIKEKSNSVYTFLALCTFADGHLSMFQV